MAPSAEHDLDQLAASIERFRLDAERFFNGALQVPPEGLRTQIQRELRGLRERNLKSAVEQFRMISLEARFNSLSELFGRRLREREEGHGPMHPVRAVAAPRRLDPRRGILLDQRLDGEAVEALFTGLVQSGGGARLDLDTFRAHLRKQLDTIRERTGAERAQFRLTLEEGKLKLKAKPVDGRD